MPGYSKLTIAVLKTKCRRKDIPIRSKDKKVDLIAKLQEKEIEDLLLDIDQLEEKLAEKDGIIYNLEAMVEQQTLKLARLKTPAKISNREGCI